MRKLGHGHSIMFFAPLEVDRYIRSLATKGPRDSIDTMDILHWAIRETCEEIQERAPQWAQQGMDHLSRFVAWSRFCKQSSQKLLSDRWLQPEAKRLVDLYAPQDTVKPSLSIMPAIRQRCDELGVLSLRNASVYEEQEREIDHEVERERQAKRPPRVRPATHSTHRDVVAFVKTGIVPAISSAFRPAFKSLGATSAASNEAHIWSPSVLVTTDFETTVQSSKDMDDFLRPVQWVVSANSSQKGPVLVILSPHEANHLMRDIRTSDNVHLHLYTPRVTKFMKPCNDPPLYCVPTPPAEWTALSHLMDQLNIFSGQLYFKDYKTYIQLCRFLCVYARDLEGKESIEVGNRGFIEPWNRPRHLKNMHTFRKTPLPSLKTLMGLRRKGMRVTLTHMGKLLDGRLLSEGDFDGCGDVRLILLPFFFP